MSAAQPITTQIRGNFPGKAPKPKRKNAVAQIEAIVKTRDPYTGVRISQGSKCDALFKGVEEGDCFTMPPSETARAERALRQWLEKNGIEGIVRRQSNCEDGKGRVWLLKVLKKGGAK